MAVAVPTTMARLPVVPVAVVVAVAAVMRPAAPAAPIGPRYAVRRVISPTVNVDVRLIRVPPYACISLEVDVVVGLTAAIVAAR